MKTKKIVFTVFCVACDAEQVASELFDADSNDSFFFNCDAGLANASVQVLDPTPEEDVIAAENLDL